VTVNGVRVRSARLAEGDEWCVGHYSIRMRFNAPFNARPALNAPVPSEQTPAAALEYTPASNMRTLAPVDPEMAASLAGALATAQVGAWEPSGTAGPPVPFDPDSPLPEWGPDNHALLSSMMLMMNQFGLHQQRKLDRFMQSIVGKIQESTVVIRDEQHAIRQDLESLRTLAEEFSRVKGELHALRSILSTGPGLAALPDPNLEPIEVIQTPPRMPTNGDAEEFGEFYAWLSQRVDTLQDEQQTLWQKLVSSMLGRHGSENAAP
jgi:hypothetical protein